MKRYVILDRDGTIITERHYLSRPEQVELLPNAAEGLQQLQDSGLGLIVITNQSGIERGYFTFQDVEQVHSRMAQLLAEKNIKLDGIYICPHKPENNCECRKPNTGLVNTAAEELAFHPPECFVIGDKPCDIDMGRRVNATTFLVKTGYGSQYSEDIGLADNFIVSDLLEASQRIHYLLQGQEKLLI